MLLDIGLGNNILGMTAKAQATKAKIYKWDCIKLKISAQQRKQTISKVKKEPVEWMKIFATHTSVKTGVNSQNL